MAKGINNFSRKEWMRLLDYLVKLQLSGECVFFEQHGHTNHFTINITPDRQHYSRYLYEREIDLPPYEHNFQDYMRNRNWKEFVDGVISDIEGVLSVRKEKTAELERSHEEAQRKRYEELKAKYEPTE
jgi:hypothetical protein